MEVDDHLKSATGNHHHHQMEMMSMIMDHMDNLPEFYGSYSEMSEIPSPELNHSGTSATAAMDGIIGGASPPFMNHNHHPNTISFMGGSPPGKDSSLCPSQPGFSPHRWRSGDSAIRNQLTPNSFATQSQKKNSMAAMREMIFRIAAMQPIHIDPESVKPPKRRNVKISKDPQSVAARHRRERISEKIRILQRLVPGGTKMDTASMLDEAIHYVKFLKSQVQSLERVSATRPPPVGFPVPMSNGSYVQLPKTYPTIQNGQHFGDA